MKTDSCILPKLSLDVPLRDNADGPEYSADNADIYKNRASSTRAVARVFHSSGQEYGGQDADR